jgi:hypothetical protein
MKYLRRFNENTDLYEDIAKDIYEELLKLSKDGVIYFEDYEEFMKSRNANLDTIDGVVSYLVDMGINFE